MHEPSLAIEMEEVTDARCICVSGEEVFAADTVAEAIKLATATHPDDKGWFTRRADTDQNDVRRWTEGRLPRELCGMPSPGSARYERAGRRHSGHARGNRRPPRSARRNPRGATPVHHPPLVKRHRHASRNIELSDHTASPRTRFQLPNRW
jgi:hypothetical protein